ncbi:MAG TPA: glutamine--fructose-6-phosphate aminotransferase [Blastocatellia bacterium]|nr:glutamine--fructose-6-phosphate aminotransferase [Blastocatellia bacterium]
MCGIVGYVGDKQVVGVILDGLRKLEYRGYDSAGIAVVDESGRLAIRRASGKLRNLEEAVRLKPLDGTYGVGHTRWATHGRPTEENAHPHRDCTGRVVVVHNGIIENFLQLKQRLQSEDHTFVTETDTEVIAHLIEKYISAGAGSLEAAVSRAVLDLRGIYALAIMSSDEPEKIVAVRQGPPIVIGLGQNEYFVASDIPPVLYHTRDVFFLGDGEIAVLTRGGVAVTDFEGSSVTPNVQRITWDPIMAEKGGFKHYMLKEIYEQPRAVRESREKGAKILAICNVQGSMLTREAHGTILTHAGPEIGVASTKAFTSQMTVLYLLALYMAQHRGRISEQESLAHVQALNSLPVKMETLLGCDDQIDKLAREFHRAQDFLYLGRGINFPIALEGALKLKEISYIHAEGYPAGEMKHGPNALIDEDLPVVVVATCDQNSEPSRLRYEKTLSNMVEVKARDGKVIAVVSEGDEQTRQVADHIIEIPAASDLISPILSILPLQLLAYHIGVRRGCDVDQPRNLAKSVTVE